MIPLRILGPKVLVALEPKGTEIEASTGMNYHDKGRVGSIILAQPTDMYDADDHSRGMVVAVGEKKGVFDVERARAIARNEAFPASTHSVRQEVMWFLDKLERRIALDFIVEVGDVVLFSPAAGVSLGEQDDGVTYVILMETDLIAVIPPKESAVA